MAPPGSVSFGRMVPAALLAAAAAIGAAGAPRPGEAVGSAYCSYRLYTLAMTAEDLPQTDRRSRAARCFEFPLTLYLGCAGESVRQVWWLNADRRLAPVTPQQRDVRRRAIRVEGARAAADIELLCRQAGPPWVPVRLTVRADIAGRAVQGTFRLAAGGADAPFAAAGTVTGTVETYADLVARNGLAPGHDYPCWRNADGSGASRDGGGCTVESWQQARLAWRSEDNVACSWRNAPVHNFLGGYASCVVAGGRVYLYYFRPADRGAVDAGLLGMPYLQLRHVTLEDKRRWSHREADEVVVCMDAATGMTVWKTSFPGAVNWMDRCKRGPFNTPCVAGGKLYVQGTRMQVFCLDAATGELVWRHDFLGGDMVNGALQVADGVVAATGPGYHALYGLDARTGAVLWGPVAGIGSTAPARWHHDGTAYFVTSRALVEARTGKVMWKFPPGAGGTHFLALSGDYVVCYPADARRAEAGRSVTCFRIAPDKAEEVWALPDRLRGWWASGPVIYRGHVYGTSLYEVPERPRHHALFCAELRTGRVVELATRADEYIAWCAGGGLIVRGTRLYKADPDDFRQLGEPLPVSTSCTTPVLVDDRLFMRCNLGYVLCYDLRAPPPP